MGQPEFTVASFNQFLSEKKLMGSKCAKCGATYLPPRALCKKCHSQEMEWVEMVEKGKLAAFTCIAVGSTMMCQEGFDRKNLYCSGIVELDSGQKIASQILGVNANQPDAVKVGTPLEIEFVERGEGDAKKTYLGFKAVGAS